MDARLRNEERAIAAGAERDPRAMLRYAATATACGADPIPALAAGWAAAALELWRPLGADPTIELRPSPADYPFYVVRFGCDPLPSPRFGSFHPIERDSAATAAALIGRRTGFVYQVPAMGRPAGSRDPSALLRERSVVGHLLDPWAGFGLTSAWGVGARVGQPPLLERHYPWLVTLRQAEVWCRIADAIGCEVVRRPQSKVGRSRRREAASTARVGYPGGPYVMTVREPNELEWTEAVARSQPYTATIGLERKHPMSLARAVVEAEALLEAELSRGP